jgi:hypothetical protein
MSGPTNSTNRELSTPRETALLFVRDERKLEKDTHSTAAGTCYYGQLTEAGRVQTEAVGALLRERYVKPSAGGATKNTQYLTSILDPADLFVRSTDCKRTCKLPSLILD